MKLTFELAFSRLIDAERGFTADPNDPGNWTGGRVGVGELKGTKFGIAANTYPDLDIKNLTLEQAQAIYRRDWWDHLGAERLDGALVYQLWDFAVNAGMVRSIISLQRAVGVADDGVLGDLTEKAVLAMDVSDVILRFNAERLRFYPKCSAWPHDGGGWINRVAHCLDLAAADTE